MSPVYAGLAGSAANASAASRVLNQARSVPLLLLQCSVIRFLSLLSLHVRSELDTRSRAVVVRKEIQNIILFTPTASPNSQSMTIEKETPGPATNAINVLWIHGEKASALHVRA